MYPTQLTHLIEPSKFCSPKNRIDDDDYRTTVTSNSTTNPQGWKQAGGANYIQATANTADDDLTSCDDLGATDKDLADGELEAGAYIATTTCPGLMLPYVKGRMNKWAAKWERKLNNRR